ncbi:MULTISPECIES: ribbon-helix-helix protein, CopG family [unclassified Gilliamella]|uniref:ribbon-helix-helix protein, CopG family n=1 Tax=unclassified Gilliamella TaxID=2685620 RepID=UPI00080DB087|nr:MULTISPECIES: ribbon-helix-helix protein, CopG family [Gilliamella]OCG77933.1 ribbon-helix-helix protein, CopG family [Gilliamella apicola]OTQ71860.1 ribbon-helix-helix protein, CopG family [Gilliamella sp. N-G2]
MAKSITEIQAKSDQKRGVKVKGFKLHVDDIALIEQASKSLDIPQAQLIVDAVKYYLDNKKAS